MSKEDIIRMGEAVKSCICAEQQGVEQRLRLTVDGKTYAVTVEEIKNPIKKIGCKAESAIGWTYCEVCGLKGDEHKCKEWRTKNRAEVEVGI